MTSRIGIANVFGEFHSKLHDEERDDNGEGMITAEINEILEFSKMRCRLQSTG